MTWSMTPSRGRKPEAWCVTGPREVSHLQEWKARDAFLELLLSEKPGSVKFGGAKGVDYATFDVAAQVVDSLLAERSPWVPIIRLVCPDTALELPVECREGYIRRAHVIVQLHQKITRNDGWAAFHYRNAWMVKRSDRLIYFDNGDRSSGSSSTAEKARASELPITTISL